MRHGFTRRRATLHLYAWSAVLAGTALATRFVPFREGGERQIWPPVTVFLIASISVATSLNIVTLVEILKLRRLRALVERRRAKSDERALNGAVARSR